MFLGTLSHVPGKNPQIPRINEKVIYWLTKSSWLQAQLDPGAQMSSRHSPFSLSRSSLEENIMTESPDLHFTSLAFSGRRASFQTSLAENAQGRMLRGLSWLVCPILNHSSCQGHGIPWQVDMIKSTQTAQGRFSQREEGCCFQKREGMSGQQTQHILPYKKPFRAMYWDREAAGSRNSGLAKAVWLSG